MVARHLGQTPPLGKEIREDIKPGFDAVFGIRQRPGCVFNRLNRVADCFSEGGGSCT